MPREKNSKKKNNNGATVGYEQQLWQMADALRGSMDAAEYNHVVLGVIFFKYISDAFEEQHSKLESEKVQSADPEDPAECIDGQIAHGDTFHNDRHPDLKADFVLGNLPFNISELGRRSPARRQALAVRQAAGRERQLRLGATLQLPSRTHRHRRLRPRQRLHLIQSIR